MRKILVESPGESLIEHQIIKDDKKIEQRHLSFFRTP